MDRVLLISNPRAGSVSARVREVIVKALEADFKLEVVDTAARNHATELTRDAAALGFDAVLVFGGDGTVNEAAQALVGTDVALGILPGGSTNVMGRALGVPRDPVEATAFNARLLRTGTTRVVNAGRFGQRYFLFSAGMGLDGEVVRRVEADPEGKARSPEGVFVRNAFIAGLTQYRGADPFIELTVDGEDPVRLVTVVCCNGAPFTYYRGLPVDVCPEARLDLGLDFFGLRRLRARYVPGLIWALFVSRGHVRWRQSYYHHDVTGGTLRADRPLPVQVDGDYIGTHTEARVELVPRAVRLLAL